MVYAITGHSYNCMLFIPIPFAIFKWSYEQVAWNIDDDIKA